MTGFHEENHPRSGEGRFIPKVLSDDEIRLIDTDLQTVDRILPNATVAAWKMIVPFVPDWAYLSGGTALAVHLHHRLSRDLDFFTERSFDAGKLSEMLTDAFDMFAPTQVEDGTVNGVLAKAKLQFLNAETQRLIEAPTMFAGLRVASVPDILATKVKVIGDRPALRDYFDLMIIEQKTSLTVTEGFGLYVEKYEEGRVATSQIPHLLSSLGYFDDVDEDPGLPVGKAEVQRYWTRRQPEVAKELGF